MNEGTALKKKIEEFRDRGDLFGVYDQAIAPLKRPDGAYDTSAEHLDLKHLAVLALARSGAPKQAEKLFEQLELARFLHDPKIRSLQARLLKDRGLALTGIDREHALRNVADRYHAIYAETGDPYPGINAATLLLLAGATDRSTELARALLADLEKEPSLKYYGYATIAEAHLILGNVREAQEALSQSLATNSANLDDIVGTKRQLRRICHHHGEADTILEVLKPPAVAHFCGHIMTTRELGGRLLPEDESHVSERVKDALETRAIGLLFGALAAGADIIIAEQALHLGLPVHVVLPWDEKSFIEQSVSPFGEEWVARYQRCMEHALVTKSLAVADTNQLSAPEIAAASTYAMGLALARAASLEAEALQIAVYDSKPELDGAAGTGHDIARWKARARETILVTPPSANNRGMPANGTAGRVPSNPGEEVEKPSMAMLFCDFVGFSAFDEDQIRQFVQEVLSSAGNVLNKYREEKNLLFANTWGDGIFLVFDTAKPAACCALALQRLISGLPSHILGIPDEIALRIGGHCGPVFELQDPITRSPGFFGTSVNRAARIEPVTPPEEVYVSEAFAAKLALENAPFSCDYVGEVPSAKNYGSFRMFLLRETSPAAGDDQA